MKRFHTLFYLLLVLSIFFEVGISYKQYKNQLLDGDLANVVVPSTSYQTVLHHPLGLPVILKDSVYANPNRFFAHFSTYIYFQKVPVILQNYCNVPAIESIYISTAIAKTIIQIFVLYFLSALASLTVNPLRRKFILSAAILAPLFQTFGYNVIMGIIDPSVTYTFFYALSFGFLLWFFYPLVKLMSGKGEDISFSWTTTLVPLSFVVSFNSALNPAVVLLLSPVLLVIMLQRAALDQMNFHSANILNTIKNLPLRATWILLFISFLSLYSLYIGQNNSENLWATIPLIERYQLLPKGLFSLFTQKIGPSMLLGMLIMNFILLKKKKFLQTNKNLALAFKIITILSLIYLLLLPLGGYRSYREYIIRRDTFMPVWLSMMALYSFSSVYLLRYGSSSFKKYYIPLVLFISFAFFNADLSIPQKNQCEKEAIITIASSQEDTIKLNSDCRVLSWVPIYSPQQSAINIELLKIWNVLHTDKLYYTEPKE